VQKNIAIIIPTLQIGGAEKQSIYLAKVLCKNHNINFIVLYGNMIEKKYLKIIEKERIHLIPLYGSYVNRAYKLYMVLKKSKTEYIFSYLASGNFFNGLFGSLAGVQNRIGGIRSSELSKKKIYFERFFHNYLLTKTISNSYSAVKGLSKQGFKKDKFSIVHNAFVNEEPLNIRDNNNCINILSVARFVPQKDYFTALKAVLLLKEQLDDSKIEFKYYLIGYGILENQIRTWIEELNIEDKVNLIIKPDNLFQYFKEADIFLSTSLFEGISNSVMEAMSYSLPIIATPAGDMEYLVKEDINGFICAKKNPVEISIKLEKLIIDFKLRKAMGLKSYKIVSEEFALEKFQEKYNTFMKKNNEKQ
jgi:glycosyltransferase involved in cell wall biosynthesis